MEAKTTKMPFRSEWTTRFVSTCIWDKKQRRKYKLTHRYSKQTNISNTHSLWAKVFDKQHCHSAEAHANKVYYWQTKQKHRWKCANVKVKLSYTEPNFHQNHFHIELVHGTHQERSVEKWLLQLCQWGRTLTIDVISLCLYIQSNF